MNARFYVIFNMLFANIHFSVTWNFCAFCIISRTIFMLKWNFVNIKEHTYAIMSQEVYFLEVIRL